LPVLFVAIDADARFVRWNKRVEKVLHYSGEELSRLNVIDAIAEEGRELMKAQIQEALATGFCAAESALLTKDGVKIAYYLTAAPLLVEGKPCIANRY
jgi:PAS domain S-box-containing protein